MPPVSAYLALGSNLGDRLALLRAAVRAVDDAPGTRVNGKSPVFETDAVASGPQPAYLNAVLRIETTLSPQALLNLCLGIERSLGRERPADGSKAPRTIDIDILLYSDLVLDQPHLAIPHPALLLRPFVLIPLATVAAPGLLHPQTRVALDACGGDLTVRPFSAAP